MMRTTLAARLSVTILALALAFPALADDPETLTTVILVRHAEKAFTENDPDPALVREGVERARRLAYVLGGLDVAAVYSTPTTRTRDTAKPLAEAVGVEIAETPYTPTYAADMAKKVREEHSGDVVVIVGHSNTTPDIARALGTDAPSIPESDYDNLFVVTFSKSVQPRLLTLRY